MRVEPKVGSRGVTGKSAKAREKEPSSPYFGIPVDKHFEKTLELIDSHPLDLDDLVKVVIGSWNSIFESTLGSDFRIGTHIFPSPQVLGFLIHELVPLEFEKLHPGQWRRDTVVSDKDLVNIENPAMSVEIKTSSSKKQIFGNRSSAQQNASADKKAKSGFYLAVNFERWKDVEGLPSVRLIRFGWLDHSDWYSQKKATGQQGNLPPAVENVQLLTIYEKGATP